jgi:phytoene dehydrogenase-like protein
METADAVTIGAGHRGLVSAAVLAEAGWDVLVLKAGDKVGGAVSSGDRHGWVLDEFSSCHPLAIASPVLNELHLGECGLRWSHAPGPLARLDDPLTPWARRSTPIQQSRRGCSPSAMRP